MTSFKQIEANRRNARKSTGPVLKQPNSVPAAMPFVMGSLPRP